MPLNHDCAYYLGCAKLILAGAIPDVDYFNTPLPICEYLHLIPVGMAELLRLEIPKVFNFLVLITIIYSTAAIGLLLKRSLESFSEPGILLLMAVWMFFSILVMINGQYGQREHLFILVYVPLLLCRKSRYEGAIISRGLAFAIGLVAAPFMLIKPHFVLVAFILEAWMLLRSRDLVKLLAPEIGALVLVVVLYLLHFLFLPDSMKEALFHRWIPLHMAHYAAYNCPWSFAVQTLLAPMGPSFPSIAVATLAGLAVIPLANKPYRDLAIIFALGALAGIGIYLSQQKCWTYHIVPAMGFVFLMITIGLVGILDKTIAEASAQPTLFWPRTGVFCLLCLGLVLLTLNCSLTQFVFHSQRKWTDDFVDAIRAETTKSDRVTFISSSIDPGYPALILADRAPGTRYMITISIPFLYDGIVATPGRPFPYRDKEARPKEEQRFLAELGEDVINNHPKMVFIDARPTCQGCPKGFCIDDYLHRTDWFGKFMGDYEKAGYLHWMTVYIRK